MYKKQTFGYTIIIIAFDCSLNHSHFTRKLPKETIIVILVSTLKKL